VIPYGRQSIDDDDVAAVVQVLKGDWLTQGPHVAEFEEALAARVGARFAVAFANGTAALHAAAAAGGLGPGDTVAVSPLSFVASANCARYVGASVVFGETDPATLNLDLATVPPAVDGLVVVHYAGRPVDLAPLAAPAAPAAPAALGRRPRVVIEDACHALGATTPDGPVGNCARSDMCVFSFHPAKAITTGEGGAVTTNDPGLAGALRRFRNHGIVPQGGWEYDVESHGWNYRMTDLQAALGASQLGKLDRFVARRRALADRYRAALAGLPVELPPPEPGGFASGWHLFVVRVPDRRRVYEGMRAAGVGVQVHYVPIYRHSAFGAEDGSAYPHTEAAYAGLLSLPLFPDLTEAEQDAVVERLAALL